MALAAFSAVAKSASGTPDLFSDTAEVIALASDAVAFVIRDTTGELTKYGVGERISGSTWIVTRVASGKAILQSSHLYHGQPMTLLVKVGDRFPLIDSPEVLASAKTSESIPKISNIQANPLGHPRGRP